MTFHTKVSLVKSSFRIISALALIKGDLLLAGIFLILAEIFGIIEEF